MPTNKKKILIAEDERPIATALNLKLTAAGYEVTVVGDGEEALTKAKSGKFDLIILDLIMPKVDGFEVLAGLKQAGSKVPVIVQSNLSQGEDEKKVKDLGARAFFIKSNTPLAKLVSEIDSILK